LVFLVFNDSNNIFLGNLNNQYEFKDLEKILKSDVKGLVA
jgi:RNA recognition motif-containing protein